MNGSRVQADFVDIKREFVGDQELLLIFLHKEFSTVYLPEIGKQQSSVLRSLVVNWIWVQILILQLHV